MTLLTNATEQIMEKVEMVVSGRRALVDADQVKKVARKQDLVARALVLQNTLKQMESATAQEVVKDELMQVMSKIIRLNRTIRQNIRFI
jgi:2,4-dienoyl-CoA reductase-like NADH-dependent reductase (Old Yellow Enzyme family)